MKEILLVAPGRARRQADWSAFTAEQMRAGRVMIEALHIELVSPPQVPTGWSVR